MKRNSTSRKWVLRSGRLHVLIALALSSVALFAQVLPPLPALQENSRTLPAATRLFVRGFQFEGNRAFTALELTKVTESFINRELTSEELEQARRAISLYYVNHGYINSGAIIPDQDPTGGVILIRIVEGGLSGIILQGNKWLRDSFITNRLNRWSGPPLNLNELQEGLQLIRQNPNVSQINAELKPGTVPGESVLDLRVVDQQPFRLGLQVDNERPPSVGAYQIWALMSDVNLTGHSDPLDLKYGIANASDNGPEFSGIDNLEASYALPLNRFDTTLGLHGSRLNTSIIEDPFLDLNITSLTTSLGVFLRQPVYQTANQELAVSMGFDWRKNKTWLLDEPFDISPGAEDGQMIVSVLRLSQEWLHRGQNHVLGLRSTFNVGLDVLDATDNGIPGDPNANFFSWLGQGQYVQRLFHTQNQLILRVSGQWTSEPLLALEQFSVGGFATVRGYLENQLVRDRGIVSSVEFRVPVLFNKAGAGIVQLAPFFDYGGAWNVEGSPSPTSIYSIGSGLLVAPNKHVSFEFYWGYRLRHVDIPDNSGAQGLGISFKLNLQAF
jgi:hemolysin activation/secretion protein